MSAIPKPYPPTLIDYTHWDDFVDKTETMRERLTFYPGNEVLPLSAFYYRVGDNGLIFRRGADDADEYVVINAFQNAVGWYSMLSICRVFRAIESGFYIEWTANCSAIVADRKFWPGGLEKEHGRYNEGLITFEWANAGYRTVTTDGIGNTTKNPAAVNWTVDTKFKIEYLKIGANWVARFYCDDVLKTTHTGAAENVPTAMDASFFVEVAHEPTGPPVTEAELEYKWRSFTYGTL